MCIPYCFRNEILPIVMGAHPDDYQEQAPFGSYIHVDDFESPRHLSEYLHALDQNDDLYNKYFDWKNKGRFIDTKFWCRLCALLHKEERPKLVIEDLNRWWRPPGICLPGQGGRWRG